MKTTNYIYFLMPLFFFLFTGMIFAQEIKISGIVIDSASNESLSGANVFITDASIGTTTDVDGYFSLLVPKKYQSDSLIVSYLGYDDFRISIEDVKPNIVIKLIPQILSVEKGITVYADKLDLARKELPHATNVIRVEEIERYGTSEISDLFKLDPAVRIEGNDLDGRFIAIRGSDADEVNVYVDGILINSLGFNNAADLSAISPDNIEKMEIMKGSNLVLLGSGAFGGVVNITTRKTIKPEYTLKFRYGSSLNRLIAADLNIPVEEKSFINYFGTLGTFSPEIEYYRSERFDEKTETTEVKTTKQNHHITFNHFTDGGQYTGKVMGYILDYNKPDWQNIRKNILVAAAYKGEVLKVPDFDFMVNYLYGDDAVERGEPGSAKYKSTFTTQRLHLRLAKNFSNDPKSIPHLGFQFLSEYFHDELLNKLDLQDATRSSTLYNAFLYDNRASLGGVVSIGDKLDSLGEVTWKLFGGIRGEFLAIGDNYKNSTYGIQVDFNKPNWRLTPYLNYGENIKFPTLLDNAYILNVKDLSISNSSLEPVKLLPELSQSREAGINFKYWATSSFYKDIDFQIAYFSSEISNKILKRPLEDVIIETQLGVNYTNGFETMVKWNDLWHHWSFSAAYGYFDVSNPLVYAYKPDEKYSLQIDYHNIDGFYALGLFYHEGKSIAWDYNDLNQFVTAEVPPFYDIDISLGYQFILSYFKMKVFASGYNILDNAGYRFYNLKKRFLQVGIGIKY